MQVGFYHLTIYSISQASVNDNTDCVKSFICQAASKQAVDPFEYEITSMFGNNPDIDLRSGSVEFDLAALIGRTVGAVQCDRIYARCPMTYDEVREVLESSDEQIVFNQAR